jgi:hypothetical protein
MWRGRWMREQGMFDRAHLVFVDEIAANTKMMRLSGRCRRGERLIGGVPQGHWKTITFVAALRCGGIRALCNADGSMKRSQVSGLCQTVSGSNPQAQACNLLLSRQHLVSFALMMSSSLLR